MINPINEDNQRATRLRQLSKEVAAKAEEMWGPIRVGIPTLSVGEKA